MSLRRTELIWALWAWIWVERSLVTVEFIGYIWYYGRLQGTGSLPYNA